MKLLVLDKDLLDKLAQRLELKPGDSLHDESYLEDLHEYDGVIISPEEYKNVNCGNETP